MKTTTLPSRNSMRRSPLRFGFLLHALALAVAGLAPSHLANAQCPQTCDSNSNTAFGVSQVNGVENTVVGAEALMSNQTGRQNTVVGALAAWFLNGSNNVAIGDKVLANTIEGDTNTGVGYAALNYCSGDNNIGIGAVGGAKLTTGSDNIDIGNQGEADDARTIRIGNIKTQRQTFIAGISGVTVADGVGVIVGTNGKLGTVVSSARYKDEIRPMDKASEAILALKPVTFRYKHELDPAGVPQFGLVAEDVEKVNPDLVARDEHGKPYTVRYEAVNAMLLNEFLKEHRKVEQQRKDFEAAIACQQKQIEALTAVLQKVSAQLEASKSAPKTVATNQ